MQESIKLLNKGLVRVAEKKDGMWVTNTHIKSEILRFFQENACSSDYAVLAYDKVPLKNAKWTQQDYESAGFRAVPGSIIRYGSYVERKAVLMPCFINIGAYIGENTMIDTWSTIGSCAQIGKNCHISGGVGIGGVLEPLQAAPVIIEDGCFIGARSEIAEGVIVQEGAVISMGVFIGASTKIVHRETGEITFGKIPPYSVVVPGVLPSKKEGEASLSCAVIVKQVDEKTRAKTSINDLLRL
jgi:2,3,4,5-tetrahydropyridine-2-carboxylate N-succinyltransferase